MVYLSTSPITLVDYLFQVHFCENVLPAFLLPTVPWTLIRMTHIYVLQTHTNTTEVLHRRGFKLDWSENRSHT